MRLALMATLLALNSIDAQTCHSLPSFRASHGRATVSVGTGEAWGVQASAGVVRGLYATQSVRRFHEGAEWYTGLDEYVGWQIGDKLSLCPYVYAAYYEASGDEFTKGSGVALGFALGSDKGWRLMPSVAANWRGTAFRQMQPNRAPEEMLYALALAKSRYGIRLQCSIATDRNLPRVFRLGVTI